jgi:hypothetical protein
MLLAKDPRLHATVRWVFLFIRHEIHRGHSLSDIELHLSQAVHSGKLDEFIKLFDKEIKDAAINGPLHE